MRQDDPRETCAEMAAEMPFARRPEGPRHGRLKVSVRTMDLIIYAAVALLAATLILGVLTAGR